jgi:hypothetical protein
MSKKSYAELLKDPRWQRKRLEVLEKNDFQCQSCGDKTTQLHVHHGCYLRGRRPWEYEDQFYHVLCDSCHQLAHKKKDILDHQIGQLAPCYYDNLTHILVASGGDCESVLAFNMATFHFCELLGINAEPVMRAVYRLLLNKIKNWKRHGF